VFADAFGTIGRRVEAFFAAVDNTAATRAADVVDVRDVRAVDSFRALLRHEKEGVRRHASTTTLESDIRVETLESGRALVHSTYGLAMTTSCQRVVVAEDSVAARLKLRTQTLTIP